MTLEEVLEYGKILEESKEEFIKRYTKGVVLHPIYKKHLPASWIIQDVWGWCYRDKISQGKARELTSAIIELHNTNKLD